MKEEVKEMEELEKGDTDKERDTKGLQKNEKMENTKNYKENGTKDWEKP